jgi:cation transport regulator ChaC
MSQKKLVFGFGSLINTSSLLMTAPSASDIRPAYVKGFRRDFSVWAKDGWSTTNLDLAGIPFCALDIQQNSDAGAKVNGVIFTVNDTDFLRLKERECEYEPTRTTVYDFTSDEPIGECLVFSSCKNNGNYDPESPAQTRYLEICLEGSKRYGENFYQMFLDTTFIDDKRLSDMPELLITL